MINYLIDSENIGTKWISYLDENIEELDKAFLFYTDASKSISCKELSVLFSFIHQLETIHCPLSEAWISPERIIPVKFLTEFVSSSP